MSSFCRGCGTSMAEGENVCGKCGRDSSSPAPAIPVDPAVAFGLPPETSGKAIFSLVSGVLSLFPPFALVAVIFGHLSLSEIRKSPGRLTGRGLAIAGLVLGYAGVAFTAVLLTIGVVSVSQELRARKSVTTVGVHDLPPVAAVRTLNTAEIAYAAAHPDAGFTCSLSDLSGAWGITGGLARGQENGYIFELQGCTAKKTGGPVVKYQVVAYPATGTTGKPAFCSNESDLIKTARSGSPQDCLRAGVELPVNDVNHSLDGSQRSSD